KKRVITAGDKNRLNTTIMIRARHMGKASCKNIDALLCKAIFVFSGTNTIPTPYRLATPKGNNHGRIKILRRKKIEKSLP
ncbi:MAG: hypothetical protein QNK25_01140, partial [Desulfobacterales bacterium]|nr:hypothetical protein [Desulfobacterales bacterium]